MSFHLSAQDARIENRDGKTWLLASLQREDGEWQHAEFNLDTIIGNNDGHFQWGGQDFTGSAQNITFDPKEGVEDQPILRAELQDCAGEWHARDVNLTEIVENINGEFQPKF